MSTQVTVAIVNWNGRQYLPTCLDSLAAQTHQDFEIILVDNGSTDGSIDFVRSAYPQVRLITNNRNLGFAAANNQAIRASSSTFVATLNNDTRADPAWLENLVAAMETNPGIGMCASKMLFAHRPHMINSAGIDVDRAGIAWDRLGGATDDPSVLAYQPVFGPCAGAALYRRSMLEQIGLFDEDFFCYLEDVDLAWRGQTYGWKALYIPQAQVLHHHSATGKEGSPFKNRQLGRNKVWLIAKNYPVPQLLFYSPLIVGLDLAAVGYAILTRHEGSALRGRIDALSSLPRMLRKRHSTRGGKNTWRQLAPTESPLAILRRYRHIHNEFTAPRAQKNTRR